jgi:hypothetical protein
VTSKKRHNPVDLHELLLLNSQQYVVLHLLLDAVRELFPVQISYKFFELNLIDIVGFSERVDINLNEVVVGHGLRQVKACPLLVIYLGEPVQQFVKQMQLLDLEACCIRVWVFFLCQFVRQKQRLYGLLKVLRLKVALALVEVKFVRG